MNTAVPTPALSRSVAVRRSLVLMAVASLLTLTACTGSPASSDTLEGGDDIGSPSAPTLQDGVAEGGGGPDEQLTDQQPSTDPAEEPSPPGPAENGARAAESVESALRALAGSENSVTSEEVRSAIEQGFTDAGVVPEEIEVSIDSTPTGLDVDAIQGAGRTGETCVFGEVREGEVSVAVLPVLGSGYCFVGDQR